MIHLELYYDIVSPYSYLAFTALCRYERRWNLDLELKPIFLGGLMKAVGNQAPILLPQRAPYVPKDVLRMGRYFDVPMQVPAGFPVNTLPTMRFLTAALEEAPLAVRPLTAILWQRLWSEDADVTRPEGLLEAASEASLDRGTAERLVELSGDVAVKDRLKALTDEAIERGAFGAPTYFVRGTDGQEEMFFGCDRLPVLAHELGLEWEGPTPAPISEPA